MDDSDVIQQLKTDKAPQVTVDALLTKKVDLKAILNTYIANIDSAIAATDTGVAAVVTARSAVNADGTVNANIKAELRAVEDAMNLIKAECRNYRTAFVWIRDNYT